jgi:hypothetical protein
MKPNGPIQLINFLLVIADWLKTPRGGAVCRYCVLHSNNKIALES